jgi:hypothetical protein
MEEAILSKILKLKILKIILKINVSFILYLFNNDQAIKNIIYNSI